MCYTCYSKIGYGRAGTNISIIGLEYVRWPWRWLVSVDSQQMDRIAGYFSYSRILALLRRTGNVAKRYLSCDEIKIDQNRQMVFCYSEEISLSAAEYQLLLYLMKNKGKTVTREKILEQVWDVNGNYVNNNTLTVTMKRLRDKLSRPACLKTVRSVGYRIEDTL